MLFWLGLLAGATLGWLVEWMIDWRQWRTDVATDSSEAGRLRRELDGARLEISKLQSRLQRQGSEAVFVEHTAPNGVTTTNDRLQDIAGIGQLYAHKLNQAGIHTFAELSETSIDRLTEIINPQEWQTVHFDAWIRQARALTSKTDRGK